MSIVWGLAPGFFSDWRVAKGRAKMTKRREKRAMGKDYRYSILNRRDQVD